MFFDLIRKYLVVEVRFSAQFGPEHFVDPLFEGVESEDGTVADVGDEVGVFVRVPCVCEADSRCIRTLHLTHVFQRLEIAFRLRHFFVVDTDLSVAKLRPRQILIRIPHSNVILHCHC